MKPIISKLTSLSFLFLLLTSNAIAQKPIKLESAIIENDSSINQKGKHHSLHKLTAEIIPTYYFEKNQIIKKDNASSPTRIITDINSIGLLYQNNTEFNHVEIIWINIKSSEELNTALDINLLNSFSNLRYIYIMCPFKICPNNDNTCESEKINGIIKNNNSNLKVVYTSELSE